MLNKKRGADLLVECLINQEVRKVFGVPGESFLGFLDAIRENKKIKWIGNRNEGGASFMAGAYAQLTGKPGICFVTRAPGATNASIGIQSAMQGSVPLILFVGQIHSNFIGREGFQEINYKNFFADIAKDVFEINNVDRIPEIIGRSFKTALSGRKGPVIVSLPEEIFIHKSYVKPTNKIIIGNSYPSPKNIKDTVENIKKSKNPLLIVGGSGWTSEGTKDLKSFVEKNNLPIISSFRRQDVFDNHSICYCGVAGNAKLPYIKDLMHNSDLIFAINTSISDILTDGYSIWKFPHPDQILIQSTPSDSNIGNVYQPDFPIISDPNNLFEELSKKEKIGDWKKITIPQRNNFLKSVKLKNQSVDVDMNKILLFLQKKLPEDVIICNGAGNFSLWNNNFFMYSEKARLIAPTSGSMGFGLPASIIAKLVYPKKTVVCFTGDGDFQMNLSELGSALQNNIFPIILIINNGSYGTIRMHQEKMFPKRISGTNIKNPDFVNIAKSYGFYSARIHKTNEFYEVFEKVLKSNKGAIIDIITSISNITPNKNISEIKN